MVQQRPGIDTLPTYIQGKAIPNAVKLSSNENPYPPLDSVREVVARELDSFNLYPDMGATALVSRIAERLGVRPAEIAVGAGSVEVLAQLIHASAGEGDEVIFAWRSFEAYPILTQVAGATPVPVPLTADERHDFAAMAAAVTERTRLILVCSPNNPTGTTVLADELEQFLAAVPKHVLVVFDEAYVHFNTAQGKADGLDFFRRHENVAVLHTFSKAYGLAGLRVGYAIAHPEVADLMNRVRQPFNVSSVALAAAEAALDDDEFLARSAEVNRRGMAQLVAAFRELGLEWIPSAGNFVTFKVGDAIGVNQALLRQGVIVRPIAAYGMPHWLRVSIGLPEENTRFIEALRQALA